MKIKTQLAVNMVLFAVILAIIAGSMAVTYRQIRQLERQVKLARSLERGAAELGYLSNDYLLFHEQPQRARCEARLTSFSEDLSRLRPKRSEQQALVGSLEVNRQRLKAIFAEIVPSLESPPQPLDAAAEQAVLKRPWSRLQIQVQGIIFDASRLAILLLEHADRLNQANLILVFALIGFFITYSLSNYLLIYRRMIRSISLLQTGARAIGTGNLDLRIEVRTADEVGQLSGEFNRMASSLKEVTASKAELEREIAERRRAEGALQELNEELEARVADRTALAESRTRQLQTLAVQLTEAEENERRRIADLLHDDLQQILAGARMQLQAARDGLPPTPILAEVEKLLEESIRKSRRLSYELQPAILHHAGLSAALKWLTGQMKDQYGLEVEVEAGEEYDPPERPLKVLLFRSAQELLFNVVKHARARSARLNLSGSGRQLTVTVCDAGRGFDPGILLPSAGGKIGTGLLSIRERIQAVGGSLAIESTPGAGSRISLTVPLVGSKADTAEQQAPHDGGRPRAGARPSPSAGTASCRVLFADDHPIMRQGLIAMLAGQPDIQVVGEAASGREALEAARELHPDVIVMDVSMPEMDGVEATRLIKAEMPRVRVIGLSMFEEESVAEAMRRAGAEAFVSKTGSAAELLQAIYGIHRVQHGS